MAHNFCYASKLTLIVLFLFLVPKPATSFTLSIWLHDPPYKHGTLTQDIQCYSIPYGGIGFSSHLLTYYTIYMLLQARNPWLPWLRNKTRTFNMALSTLSLLSTLIISILTMVRCRNRWQFVLIAVWKLNLSVTLAVISFHAAAVAGDWQYESSATRQRKRERAKDALWWLLLYLPGLVIGLVGLLSIVVETVHHNAQVRAISVAFGALGLVALAGFGVWGIVSFVREDAEEACDGVLSCLITAVFGGGGMALVLGLPILGLLAALYSDWVLGAVAGSLAGVPSSDVAPLYWTYFVAKRLPFFSS